METQKKVEVLRLLKERILGWDEFMCNNLKNMVEDGYISTDERLELIEDLWLDRDVDEARNKTAAWYPMGDKLIRTKNINKTILRLLGGNLEISK